MKIPTWILSLVVAANFTAAGWIINSVIELKTDVAVIKSRLTVTNGVAWK